MKLFHQHLDFQKLCKKFATLLLSNKRTCKWNWKTLKMTYFWQNFNTNLNKIIHFF
jgi:hypothetical protein